MPTAVITGAFSNTGAAVAAELARRGWSLRTLTRHAPAAPAGIEVFPLRFEAEPLRRAMSGADVFVNTYWVRFPHGGVSFESAVGDSRTLIEAARAAGVRRFVQVGVSNASESSPLGYYRGKAAVDRLVRASGLDYAIVRPTLIVGPRDVLTHNIAWFLRRFPVFAIPSGGEYRLQPILRDEVARILADAAEGHGPLEMVAAGPEAVSFATYVARIAEALGVRRARVRMPRGAVLLALRALGALLNDTVLTGEELEGLRQDLLVSKEPPTGSASVFDWMRAHAADLGRAYVNDTRGRF